MKLHEEQNAALNTVTAYGPGYIEINAVRHQGAVVVVPDQQVKPWPVNGMESLTAEHFEPLLAFKPDLVLVGSGPEHRFVPPRIVAPLMKAGVGVESMSSAAACRTYNILMAEGRRVVAALLPL